MSALGKMLAPIEGRVRLMLARAIVRLVDDAAKAQELQLDLLEGESQDAVERFQQYGFTSVPKPGAEAIVAFLGGLRSHGVVIAVEDRRFRLKSLQPGEVALYDDLGNVVKLGREQIDIVSESKVVITAPGDVHVNGDVIADGVSLKTHTHADVEPGAGQSGGPVA